MKESTIFAGLILAALMLFGGISIASVWDNAEPRPPAGSEYIWYRCIVPLDAKSMETGDVVCELMER